MWGSSYADINIRDNWSRAYYLVYISCRFLFITIGLYFVKSTFQILALLFLNLAMTIYYGQSRAQESRFDNRLELLNEAIVVVSCYHLLFFTDAVSIET